MVRITIYLAVFAILAVFGAAEVPEDYPVENVPAEVRIVENIDDFISANPGVELVEMKVEQRALVRTYTLGRRQSGDFLLVNSRGNFVSATPRNFDATIHHSSTRTITYVFAQVQQTSNIGRMFVRSGGIGQRSITLVIEAGNTRQFIFSADIFGRN